MALAFDAATESIRTGTEDPYTFDHTPVGTPRAVVLASIHRNTTTDHIDGITYGGVAMAEGTAAVTTIELGRAEVWFLGSGIPTGTQTISVNLSSATGDDFAFYCLTFTGGADTEIVDRDVITGQGNITGGTVTMSVGGRSSIAVGAYYTGRGNPTDITLGPSGITSVGDHDFTNDGAVCGRQTNASTSDFDFGGTQPSDDFALAVLSFAEQTGTSGTGALTLPAVTMTGTGTETFSGTGALVLPSATVAGTGTETFTSTGALVLPAVTMAGTGFSGFAATGAIQLPSVTMDGSGTETFSATGAVVLPAATMVGVGEQTYAATGALILPAATMAGTGTQTLTATGALDLSAATMAGTGTQTYTATGALALPPLTMSGTGTHSDNSGEPGYGTFTSAAGGGTATSAATGSGFTSASARGTAFASSAQGSMSTSSPSGSASTS